MNNSRNILIDLLKAWAIILVVTGHCIQERYLDVFDNIWYCQWISSFHMPLFVFLSGYVLALSANEIKISWLRKRCVNLLVPFLTWGCISFLAVGDKKDLNLLSYLIELLKRPDRGYWFLFVLFVCCVFFFFLSSIVGYDRKVYIVVLLVFMVLSTVGMPEIFGIGMATRYIVFYLSGYIISKEKIADRINNIYNVNVKTIGFIISLLIFLFCSLNYRRNGYPEFYDSYMDKMTNMGIPYIISRCTIAMYNWGTNFIGIFVSFFTFSWLLNKQKWIFDKIAFIGRYTLEIYIVSVYILKFKISNNYIIDIFIMSSLGIAVPILLAILIEKFKVVGILLFGKYTKKK